MKNIKFNELKGQHAYFGQSIEDAVKRVLESGWYILGPELEGFEQEFAKFNGNKHAIGVANGTDAIEIALNALGIGQGDEVITVAHTAIASAVGVCQSGATPVFADIDPETYLIDPAHVESLVTPRTRAIMPVHLYGHPVDLTAMKAICTKHGLALVEDCSQAHGALFDGRKVGTHGDVAVFSLYPTKNLGAYGDAGVITTDDSDLADKCIKTRNYGQRATYYSVMMGRNSRMDEIQAAILREKVKRLDDMTEYRQRIGASYKTNINGLALPVTRDNCSHVYHLFVVRSERRDWLKEQMAERGVGTLVHYPLPVHMQESFEFLGLKEGDLPETERAANQVLSLPLHFSLDDDDIKYVADMVNEVVASS
ncbi:DegT/DnrJ/EryC1/StrS family aminotransferase [Primorskyibacter flagellatus]|uniref:dTDP-4-amino-4,6-dideoxygalactose transaminase n=1 Tax=Primorskyibacter flagellatus TaxID=1387277 RepID=A0A1W1ZY57_9RHOB|nr:DegT/DnrJ/EryC1/StrS family aminotransferase [Primorskyibacter flagellatus]SMC53429.1 dTDP-4-amino-4,6-dideoxygalactose transaminase [Primorskyibacter flagellatus]